MSPEHALQLAEDTVASQPWPRPPQHPWSRHEFVRVIESPAIRRVVEYLLLNGPSEPVAIVETLAPGETRADYGIALGLVQGVLKNVTRERRRMVMIDPRLRDTCALYLFRH
jgi:hypothetical protein